jgi:hypothetical protein
MAMVNKKCGVRGSGLPVSPTSTFLNDGVMMVEVP